jgi:isopentenyl-diphosphate Delta-isomerase
MFTQDKYGIVECMIDKNEMLFVVDEHNQSIDPLPRHIVHKDVLWHRSTGIAVVSKTGKVLCQRRSLQKDIKPGFWEAFFGGHLGPNESYEENARRELSEELGVPIDENQLIPYKILKSDKPTHKQYEHIFAFLVPDEDVSFAYEEEEIDEVAWKTFAELEKLLITDPDPNWVHKTWDKEVIDWLQDIAKTDMIE